MSNELVCVGEVTFKADVESTELICCWEITGECSTDRMNSPSLGVGSDTISPRDHG